MTRISVILPVYNAERYLDDCLDSILNQTLREIEVFCIDDGSTDGSPAILERRARADSRITLLNTPHLGAYKARREGYNRAVGEFLYFMDADDTISTTAFEELCALADRDDLDHIVFSATVFADADDRGSHVREYLDKFARRYELPEAVCGKIASGEEVFASLQENGCYYPSPPLRLVRSSVLKENEFGFPEAPYHGDNYFTTVSLFYAKRACVVPNKYYNRRIRTDSMTTSVGKERIQFSSTFNVILELCRFKPFASRLQAGGRAESMYMRKLVGSLSRWTAKLDDEGRRAAFADVGRDCDERFRQFLELCFVPLVASRGRPRASLTGLIAAKLRRMLSRLWR
ncbi:MAG: glycosyltransferase family 2 protein [Kiritimatiellae bacterium]|nr:glycosyltransferase family 2 protein [Kiritimatiellia bacterium]